MIKLIIADSRMPQKAKENLEKFGKVLWLEPQSTVYESIASHPDIFFFQNENSLVVAPNVSEKWINFLRNEQVNFVIGEQKLGLQHPETVFYNAVKFGNFLIHHLKYTDKTILKKFENKNQIDVNQAYTRCNLIPINENCLITSDLGIEKTLLKRHLNILYINPNQVLLSNQKNGFFPGCCGFFDKKLLVCGSTKYLEEKEKFDHFLNENGITLVELYEGHLVDVGSILTIQY